MLVCNANGFQIRVAKVADNLNETVRDVHAGFHFFGT